MCSATYRSRSRGTECHCTRQVAGAHCAASGTLKKRNSLFERRKPSYEPKKNSLSLRMGPPSVPPNMFASSGSLFGLPLFGLQSNPHGRNEYGVAFSSWLLKNSNADPRKWFVPDFVMTVIVHVRRCAAPEKLDEAVKWLRKAVLRPRKAR